MFLNVRQYMIIITIDYEMLHWIISYQLIMLLLLHVCDLTMMQCGAE